ncbi:hypothetical protein GC093_09990 [Paenibacillus sp. LMG 31456]|uniref:Uncharacterized protein n=1 Tax=Paenibacillus foliorum TaxID=2654974 RepID=A0A972K269_9BACL|nr:hypothetical protein [Paenibacillus foliorum]NOU93547.1 hypothetical protein [Paenibacillus foliorum]
MNAEAIFFEFDSVASAELAQSTLEELGYQSGVHSELNNPTLHIQIDHTELTSALEIAQAHGGRLIEHGEGAREIDAYTQAYNTEDLISIPAHTVNEDWTDEYATAANVNNPAAGRAGESGSGNEAFDPSGDDYDYFDAGIHL